MKRIMFLLLMITCFYPLTDTFALANPAAVNCTHKGFRYIFVKNIGICLFPDFSYCEEWAYFRGQCKPGQHKASKKMIRQAITPVYKKPASPIQ